ncbi:MAG: DUF4239 domain-containing protein [Curvibacter sp.]|nr:DUF4239 domain-containing protein [Curvibacter sp.]
MLQSFAYDHYAYAAVAVLGTLAAVFAIHWLIQSSPWAPWCRSLQGVVPPFINIIGVLFGLTLAFLANDTWSAHDQAMSAVYREADALRSLGTLAQRLGAPEQARLEQALQGYATAAGAEWPLLARRQQGLDAPRQADALLLMLTGPSVEASAGSATQTLMLQAIQQIRRERDLRIALSQTHINPLKWLGMAFLGFLTLLSVAVVHVERPRTALVATVLFALAAAPTATLVLIQGNPFEQPTAVTPAPLLAAVRAQT